MARIDDVENRFARTEKIASAAFLMLLGWMGVGTGFLFSMHGDIQAIKQNVKDHGSEIVRNITDSKDQAQLAANLALAGAQIRVARSENRKANPQKLGKLQSVIAEASQNYPNLPEAWQAAAQLVSYKYQPQIISKSPILPNCLDTILPGRNFDHVVDSDGSSSDIPGFSTGQARTWVAHIYLGNCILDLDDNGSFPNTAVGKFIEEVKKHHPNANFFSLVLNNARISYSGGKMLPISEIRFTDCIFELSPPLVAPPKRGQALTQQLLTAGLSSGEINLPTDL